MAEKVYTLKINGVEESVKAVDALNKQLDNLDKRIDELSKRNINVGTSGGGSAKQELSAQEQLEKQILATEQKLEQVRDENYKKLLHSKEELKEYTQIAKSAVAAEANKQGLFDTSTVAGMKAQLKSIKAEMQTIDIGGDRFRELTQQANDLNNKLKEIEQSYGQFGRNVGNYANSFVEGFEKLKIDVGGVVHEFDNAKQAYMSLKKEMQTLSIKKDQGIISEEEADRLRSLIPVVKQLESGIKDAGKPMDALLDTMQSFIAIASTAKGVGAILGLSDGEVQKTIQSLVAMQNVLQGIQTIQAQMQSQEGIGGWLVKGNAAIDKFVNSLFAYTNATKAATIATKALSVALKTIGIGIIITAIVAVVDAYKKWNDATEETIKKAEEAAEKIKKAADEQRQAYVNASVQYENTASRLSHLMDVYKSTTDQMKKTAVLKEATKIFKDLGMSVSGVADAQKILLNQGTQVIELLRLQGDAAAIAALRMEAFKKSFNMLLENGYDAKGAAILAGSNKDVVALDELLDGVNSQVSKLRSSLKIGGEKTKKTVKDVQHDINKAEIDAMKDGLNKKLMQLEEEKRQTINKLKDNGKATAENIRAIEEAFYKKRINIINEYLKELANSVKKTANELKQTKFELNIKEIEQDITKLNNMINDKLGSKSIDNPMLASGEGAVLYPVETKYGEVVEKSASGLSETYKLRMDAQRDYDKNLLEEIRKTYHKINTLRDKEASEQYSATTAQTEAEFEVRKEALRKQYEQADEASTALVERQRKEDIILTAEEEEKFNELIKIREEAKKQIQELEVQYGIKMERIQDDYDIKIKENLNEENESLRAITNSYYDSQISNLRDFLSKVNSIVAKQPTMDNGGWQIINVGATQEQFNEIKKAARLALVDIEAERQKLSNDFKDGLISPEAYNAIMRQLYDVENEIKNSLNTIDTNERNLLSDFQQSINRYIQAGLDAVRTVMDALADYQDYQFDKEEEMLNKQLDMIEDKLSEQADIIEKYKDKVDSIEDELSTARGDRRQHLIDQINAEIAAQRNAQKEEQKLQKQKEAAEKKQEKLDKERKKAEYKRNLMNILISTAMATANGLATQPFVPVGIAMGALATTLGMVQYALAAKQKPYAAGGQLDGGVAVGARHRDGGIKVLGGRAEIEGGEYITNRLTTAKNIDLLSYINSKKKKIDISDMIDFYNSGKVRTSIQRVRSKFEDGGYIPTLPASLDISDQLQNIVINQDNRPIVVSVVDINNKQEDVRRVQTLAGL